MTHHHHETPSCWRFSRKYDGFMAFLLHLLLLVGQCASAQDELRVTPKSTQLAGTRDSTVSLECSSSSKPILCLWKTPYGHVYTLSQGVFAESGRLRHKDDASEDDCGLEIVGLEDRDKGRWECEVGALIGDTFQTATANIELEVKSQSPGTFHEGQTSRQEVGNDVILHCSADREVHLCRWKTPYLNTYIVGEGIYVERGRIQWLGSDPNYDCTIRVAKLDLRDAGTWVCEIGSSTKESFQVQTKEFVIDIETPLKLSAPTALMQNANTDATLVCHANKPYDECLWTTPYGKTYTFPDQNSSHENGRIAYFGFADTDCGVIVRNVEPKDNGGWQCQLHSRNGDIFQNATDVVSLFAETTTGLVAQPRSIADYDYKSLDYDAIDYVNGDFDRVRGGQNRAQSSAKKTTTTTTPRSSQKSSLSDQIELSKITSVAPPLSVHETANLASEFAGVNPLELELLSRISGTRRDSRPVRIGAQDTSNENIEGQMDFESTKTTATTSTSHAPTASTSTTTPKTEAADMRQMELQRIRDERKKLQEEKDLGAEEQQRRQQLIVERQRLEDRRRVMDEQRRKEAEEEKLKEEGRIKEEQEKQKKIEEERRRKVEDERRHKLEEERQRQLREDEEKRKREEERQKRIEEELRQRKLEEERQKKLEEERQKKLEEERQKKLEEERQKKLEEERQKKIEEERRKKLEEERQKKIEEERQRKKAEEERLQKVEEELRAKKAEEERQKKIEEERRAQRAEKERLEKIEEEERLRKLEEEKKREEEEKKRLEEEERKKKLEEERKRQEEVQRRREETRKHREEERRKQLEEERRIKEFEERRRKEEEAQRKAAEEKKLEEEKRRKEEEEKRVKELEIKRQLELDRKRKEEEARRQAEIEKQRQEIIQREREELDRKRKEEEDRLRKEIERKQQEDEARRKAEVEKKRQEEAEALAKFEEARRNEEDEKKRLEELKREEERQRRIDLQKQRDEVERQRKLEADRIREEELVKQKRLEEERRQAEELKKQREDDRRQALERIRQDRIKQEQEELRKKQLQEQLKNTSNREQERQRIDERRQQSKNQIIATINNSNRQNNDVDRTSLIPRTESPRSFPISSPFANLPGTEQQDGDSRKRCFVGVKVANGNVTCLDHFPDAFGEYSVAHGTKCELSCKSGYVSIFQKEALCQNGRVTPRLDCVRPDALLLLAGRSDRHGVLNTVELVTNKGVCRGAVPVLPAMRWRMIAESIDKERVLACGGVNIFGDPKKDCWLLGFNPDPVWSEAPDMLVARDAAAWALEGNFLMVLGGSLGKLNGYTDSVEMHNVLTTEWTEGPRMSSSRYSHCAVGLGNGSIIVTGGYGGLEVAERLDLDTGKWWPLPELNPVRAQHGCAMVDFHGEQGVLVVGGDSGGTRLKDVRFLPIDNPSSGWRKVADLNTARWGRPGVAMVGGRITVAAGWDGVRDLDTVEYYDEKRQSWRLTASRLQFDRRWPASTPISLSLFPKCAQKRER